MRQIRFWELFVERLECRRGLAMRILSVCLSVKRVHCDKTEEQSVQIFIPYESSFSLNFREEEWLVGSDPFYLKFWINRPPSEIADFEPIFARSASAVTPSEKSSINTNRKSTMRFQMSLRRSSDVALKPPPNGSSNRKTAVFGVKSHFAWRKSATKFLYVKIVQPQSCKAFIS